MIEDLQFFGRQPQSVIASSSLSHTTFFSFLFFECSFLNWMSQTRLILQTLTKRRKETSRCIRQDRNRLLIGIDAWALTFSQGQSFNPFKRKRKEVRSGAGLTSLVCSGRRAAFFFIGSTKVRSWSYLGEFLPEEGSISFVKDVLLRVHCEEWVSSLVLVRPFLLIE